MTRISKLFSMVFSLVSQMNRQSEDERLPCEIYREFNNPKNVTLLSAHIYLKHTGKIIEG